MFSGYTLPTGSALIGAALSAFASLFIYGKEGTGFADAMLIGLMSATMGAGVSYYTGVRVLKDFGLPPDTTLEEFHRFLVNE